VPTYSEFRRWLAKQGCKFETHEGGSGHITVILGDKKTQLPAHGKGRDLGKGLVEQIKKQLGLK
jgi:mRNA interferase HicA